MLSIITFLINVSLVQFAIGTWDEGRAGSAGNSGIRIEYHNGTTIEVDQELADGVLYGTLVECRGDCTTSIRGRVYYNPELSSVLSDLTGRHLEVWIAAPAD